MKIEIAESLVLSYLKHAKQCVFYQTNWKPSSRWIKLYEEEVEALFENIKNNPEFKGVYKQTSSCSQFLKQAEIDVIGIDMFDTVYAIETAFHEQGLNYRSSRDKDNDKGTQKVIKKLLRAYFVLRTYFPNKKYKIIFASPKVGHSLGQAIWEKVNNLKHLIEDDSVEFGCFLNNKFKEEIMCEALECCSDDSDTAEIFVRSIRLYGLDKNTMSQKAKQDYKKSTTKDIDIFLNEATEKQLPPAKKYKRTWRYADNREIHDSWGPTGTNLKEELRKNSNIKNKDKLGIFELILEIEE